MGTVYSQCEFHTAQCHSVTTVTQYQKNQHNLEIERAYSRPQISFLTMFPGSPLHGASSGATTNVPLLHSSSRLCSSFEAPGVSWLHSAPLWGQRLSQWLRTESIWTEQ